MCLVGRSDQRHQIQHGRGLPVQQRLELGGETIRFDHDPSDSVQEPRVRRVPADLVLQVPQPGPDGGRQRAIGGGPRRDMQGGLDGVLVRTVSTIR